jgi:nucleoside-diphosphate-sugar epimerase
MMKKVLITGAGGFVGKAALQALTAAGSYEIHAVYNTRQPAGQDGIVWHRANLLNEDEVTNLFAEVRPEGLMQLAWCSEHGVYWKDPANLDWLTANIHIARKFVEMGGKRCLFTGTSAEYDWTGSQALEEYTTPLRPVSLYGSCKLGLYWSLAGFFEQEKVSWSWARLFNPFGPGEDARRLIPKTCLRLLRGEQIDFDAGVSLRDFLPVADTGSAMVAVLQSGITGAVNIGSGQAVTIRELIEKLAVYCKRPDAVRFEAAPANAKKDIVVADTKRLRNECGWQPSMDLDKGLQQTCQWWEAYFNNSIINVDKSVNKA